MNAVTTTEFEITDVSPKSRHIRAHMDGRSDEVIRFNSKFSPLENHQEAARLLLSRFLTPALPKGGGTCKDWYSAVLTAGKMVHVYADPRRTL